ncbi:MAG: RNA polymerase sigma factor [Candidatus Liptonbacteria bacterium]|nr:RNA polymerase sigma factor [Candidatus Liptonbacteria bacterium]
MRRFFNTQRVNRLVRRMQKGDADAADALYRELVNKVFGFCMNRVRERAAAEDLTQEIFMKLVSRIHTFDATRGAFGGWFWQIARNTVIDFYRENGKRAVPFSDMPEEHTERLAVSDARTAAEHRFDRAHMDQVLKTLTADEQELFELRFVADLPYREIAGMLGRNEASLRVAVNRLRVKIKKHFYSEA